MSVYFGAPLNPLVLSCPLSIVGVDAKVSIWLRQLIRVEQMTAQLLLLDAPHNIRQLDFIFRLLSHSSVAITSVRARLLVLHL